MSSQHMGCHALPASVLGRRASWNLSITHHYRNIGDRLCYHDPQPQCN